MKKVLEIISEYLTHFFMMIFMLALFLLYLTYRVAPSFWMGSGMSGSTFRDNFGSIFLKYFEEVYYIMYVSQILWWLGAFFVLSIFMWIYYRRDNKAGGIGFKNVILSLLVAFVSLLLLLRMEELETRIAHMRADEIAKYNKGIVKLSPMPDWDILRVYHSLYLDGEVLWRHDPLAVVEYELKQGALQRLDGENNELKLYEMDDIEEGLNGSAEVTLQNEKVRAQINLHGYGDFGSRVWMVRSYTDFSKLEE